MQRGSVVEDHQRSVIEFMFDLGEIGAAVPGMISAIWKVLVQKSVGVLVGPRCHGLPAPQKWAAAPVAAVISR
jgi:hypothetical protein